MNSVYVKKQFSQFALDEVKWENVAEMIIKVVQESIGTRFGQPIDQSNKQEEQS